MSEEEVEEIEKIADDIIRFAKAIASTRWRELKSLCRELGVLLAAINPKIKVADVEDLCLEYLTEYFEDHPFR
jgi:plasmid stabilization system protein ParE